MKNKILTMLALSILFSTYALAQEDATCPIDSDYAIALKKAIVSFLKNPDTSTLTRDEILELIRFYLQNEDTGTANCQNIADILGKADAIADETLKNSPYKNTCFDCSGVPCNSKNALDQTCLCKNLDDEETDYEVCRFYPIISQSIHERGCDKCLDGTECGKEKDGYKCECSYPLGNNKYRVCVRALHCSGGGCDESTTSSSTTSTTSTTTTSSTTSTTSSTSSTTTTSSTSSTSTTTTPAKASCDDGTADGQCSAATLGKKCMCIMNSCSLVYDLKCKEAASSTTTSSTTTTTTSIPSQGCISQGKITNPGQVCCEGLENRPYEFYSTVYMECRYVSSSLKGVCVKIDGDCDSGYGENRCTAPEDCPTEDTTTSTTTTTTTSSTTTTNPEATCGDGNCSRLENCQTCPADCGCPEGKRCVGGACITISTTTSTTQSICGDGICNVLENCERCPGDCPCPEGKTCFNGVCAVMPTTTTTTLCGGPNSPPCPPLSDIKCQPGDYSVGDCRKNSAGKNDGYICTGYAGMAKMFYNPMKCPVGK